MDNLFDVDLDDSNIIFKHGTKKVKHNKSILPDLSKCKNILPEIKIRANEIYMNDGCPNHRNTPRLKMIFSYVYQAYMELNISFIPTEVATDIGLHINNLVSSLYHITDTKYDIIIKTPYDYVDIVISGYIIYDDIKKQFIQFINTIYDNNEDEFENYLPYIITISLFLYFVNKNGYNIDTSIIIKKYKINNDKIKNINTLIDEIYNKI